MQEYVQKEIKTRGVMRFNESMSKHTCWKTGGPARCYFEPVDIDDLCHFLQQIPQVEPLFWVGLGSNLLVRDDGLNGTVITLSKGFNDISVYDDTAMHVGAGATCPKVARTSVKSRLANAEFLVGIPGTMGGALTMNAGAFGSETWDIVNSVETIDRKGHIRKRDKADFDIGYRHVVLPDQEWFISAELSLAPDKDGQGAERIKVLLNKRDKTQPTGVLSCGSVFCNPHNNYAARLIEDSGLKGKSIGNVCVSEKHANFIINLGDASATDIELLILFVQKKVKQDKGIELIPEVRIIGE